MSAPTQGRAAAPSRPEGELNPRPSQDTAALAGGLGDAAVEALAQRVADLVVDRLADVLGQRNTAPAPTAAEVRLVDAAELATLLGTSRAWVYRHADELGAGRAGDRGRGRRLLFDPAVALASLGSRESSERSVDPDGRRSPAGTRDRASSGAASSRRRRGAGATTTPGGDPLLPIRGDREIAA
jgi:hypothetical protein